MKMLRDITREDIMAASYDECKEMADRLTERTQTLTKRAARINDIYSKVGLWWKSGHVNRCIKDQVKISAEMLSMTPTYLCLSDRLASYYRNC